MVTHVDSLMKVKVVEVVEEDGVEVLQELINHLIVNPLHQEYVMLFKKVNVNVEIAAVTATEVRFYDLFINVIFLLFS